jgi:putative 4-mercaptohistidine N1-methyltranferase
MFNHVLGVDISEAALAAAQQLKENGELAYRRKDEGDLGKSLIARINPEIDRIRVQFRHVDASAPPLDIFGFDAVHMTNVLDRMANPKACLAKMGGPRGLVKPGGILLLTSPYTWLPQFTPKFGWVGGYERDGEEVTTASGLKAVLGADFELIYQEDTPLLIREHKRKFQYIITHMTIWRRQFASGA